MAPKTDKELVLSIRRLMKTSNNDKSLDRLSDLSGLWIIMLTTLKSLKVACLLGSNAIDSIQRLQNVTSASGRRKGAGGL